MPMTIFDWIARTAMLAMAGLVTLSILGAIAAMTHDGGTGFPGGERPLAEAEPAGDRDVQNDSSSAGKADPAASAVASAGPGAAVRAPAPAPEDRIARWLEAIAYALLAIAGIGRIASGPRGSPGA
jgi:hypothetical protein